MINYVISGTSIVCGAYLASMGVGAWPWFLIAGTVMFLVAAGAEMKENE